MHQRNAIVNWVINIRQVGNKICLLSSWCYWFWVYRSLYEVSYVIIAINHDLSASHDRLNYLNQTHDSKLTSKFSLVWVLIFWLPWYHPSSFNEPRSTIWFNFPCYWAKSHFWPIRTVTSCSIPPGCKIRVWDVELVTECEMCNQLFM